MKAFFEGPEIRSFCTTSPGVVRSYGTGRVNVMEFNPDTREKRARVYANAEAAKRAAYESGGEFFPRGTWENNAVQLPVGKIFSPIKPEIYRRLIERKAGGGVSSR